ncbi:MAG: hypothetical protein A2076_16715 [Geobacteraceae bacterium GWC2_53_11]|nr:MAG: hypothetical protein A2076_16715 [Geobacteraceae bacterium GWC2_53_11]
MNYDDGYYNNDYERRPRPRAASEPERDCSTCTWIQSDEDYWLCGECLDSHYCGGYTHVEDLGYMCDICGGIYAYDI